MTLIYLPHRTLITLEGPDRFTFLQGLVTCNTEKIQENQLIYGAFLTPQGKFLEDLFIFDKDNTLFLDTAHASAPQFLQKLKLYKLRANLTLNLAPDTHIYASFDQVGYKDPRHPNMGYRHYHLNPPFPETETPLSAYENQRYILGIPDGRLDMPIDRAMILEYGFDEMGAIDWEKGCYLGQELIARTKYRGLIRKRLVPFTFAGPAPSKDLEIMAQDLKAGTVQAIGTTHGLALLRLEYLQQPLFCGTTKIMPYIPEWIKLPESEQKD